MRSWGMLSTIALAGALVSAPAYALDPAASSQLPDDRTAFPYGEALTQPMTSLETIEGTVAAVDRDNGRLVLDTDGGLVSLSTWPDEVASVVVGDQVRVSFVTDNRD